MTDTLQKRREFLTGIDLNDKTKCEDLDDWLYWPHKCPFRLDVSPSIEPSLYNSLILLAKSTEKLKKTHKMYRTLVYDPFNLEEYYNKTMCCKMTKDDNEFCEEHSKLYNDLLKSEDKGVVYLAICHRTKSIEMVSGGE